MEARVFTMEARKLIAGQRAELYVLDVDSGERTLVHSSSSVLFEAPILLMAMLYAARFVPRRLRLPATAMAHLGMGVGALVLVLLADLGVGLFVRGLSVAAMVANFGTPAGRIYAALLLLFALMPWLVNRRARSA